MKNILIIGGTGIIGQPLILKLLDAGKYTIYSIALDKADFDDEVGQYVVDRNSELFEGTINSILTEAGNIDAMIDICAFSKENSERLYKLAENTNAQIITMSTTLVYDRETRNDNPITEETALAEKGLYGGYVDGKLRLEDHWLQTKDTNWTLLRGYHIVGKHSLLGCLPSHNRDRNLVEMIEQEKELELCNGGEIPLNYIHPDDIAEVIIRIIGNEKTFKQAYNLVNPEIIIAKDYYKEIARQLGKTLKIKPVSVQEIWGRKLGWEMTTFPHIYNTNKLEEDIDFSPNKPLSEAITDALNYPPEHEVATENIPVHSRMNKQPSPNPPKWLFENQK